MTGFSSKAIDLTRFKEIVVEFFGNRFQNSDVINIWKTVSGGKDKLELGQFKKLHGHVWKTDELSIEK